MLKRKPKLYAVGLFLIGSVLQTTAQQETVKETEDTARIYYKKEFLEFNTVIPFKGVEYQKYSTYSVSTVNSDDFRSINTPSLGNSLDGKLTGLMVSRSGGAPGESGSNPALQIRGRQSFVDPTMMVVVDGFQTDWNSLLPDEIESIHVLKDAAALAKFGISGANGVLYIRTKRGIAQGKDRISFNSRISMQSPSILPSFINNGEYAQLYNLAMISDGKDIANGYFSSPDIVDYFKNGDFPALYPDFDWYSEITKPRAVAQDYNLSINGGNERARYNVLLGYTNTPGLYDGLDGMNNSNWIYERYVSRINLDVSINDWLRSEVSTRAMISRTKSPNVSNNAIWNNMHKFLPYNVTTPSGKWGGTEGYPANPVAQIVQQGYSIENARTIDANIKFIADMPFAPGLSAFGQVVFGNNYFSYFNKTRGYSYEELFPDILNPGEYTSTIKGTINENFSYAQPSGTQWHRFNSLGGVEYTKEIGDGTLHASTSYSREVYTTEYNTTDLPWAKINLFGRVNYALKKTYIAEVGYSYSGTDNYAPGSRFGFFPAISGAWILSNEDFLSESSIINFLKLRASYGLVGSDRIGNLPRFMFYEYYGSPSGAYTLGSQLNTNAQTFEIVRLANPNATWEKAFKANLGAELKVFNSLSIMVDYFTENRKDIFVDPSSNLSFVVGGRYNQLNMGSAKNSGVELEMLFNENLGQLGYYLGAKVSYIQTEIVDMKEPPRAYDYLYRKGNPIGQPFVLEAIGFFADQADIDSSPFQSFGSVQPGDVKYKDQNGDNIIDNNDQIAIGNPNYPGIIYSFDFGFQFKGVDLSAFIQGVGKRTINLSSFYMTPFANNIKPVQWIVDNYWTPERGNAALYPRLTTESNPNNYRASTLWQRDGSYIRLKNVEMGYTLPKTLNNRLGIENIRIYVNATDFFTWDKIDEIDIDPEINNPFSYPSMKSINFGLTLNF